MKVSRAFPAIALCLLVGLAIAGPTKQYQAEQSRPIPLGVSGGNAEGPCFAGTLGCLVTAGGKYYILSNNHVFSRTINDGMGDDVMQPGILDNDCTYDAELVVATVSGRVDIAFPDETDPNPVNRIDAAIAEIDSGEVNTDGKILGIGNPDGANVATATVGLSVKKAGRTTGVTQGTLQFVGATVNVEYAAGEVATFVDQILIGGSRFSKAGDSGSLIVTTDLKPVALLFAGGSTYTIANPTQLVLDALQVSIVGDGTADSDGGGGGGGGGGRPGGKRDKPVKPPKSRAALDRHGGKILAMAGVTGHGIGRFRGREVIAIFVERVTPAIRAKLPRTLDGIPVKVVATGKFVAY